MIRALVMFVLGAAGCTLSYEPDVGALRPEAPDGGASAASCGDSDPETTVSFARDIRPLLGHCSCHGTGAASGLSVSSYDLLRRGGTQVGAKIVVPKSACESVLAQKLSPFPPFGSRMPFNADNKTIFYFTTTELQVVRDWIAEGALNN